MHKKLLELITAKCKDMGLTDKAIEELTKQLGEGVTEDSSDEDLEKIADSATPFAKMMQAEITRKAQKNKEKKEVESPVDNPKEKPTGGNEDEPAWFKAYREQSQKEIEALKAQNAQFATQRKQEDRQSFVAAKAKELGLPDFLVKQLAFADDADNDALTKQLTDLKQEFVTSGLAPADATPTKAEESKQLQKEAEDFVKNLPD